MNLVQEPIRLVSGEAECVFGYAPEVPCVVMSWKGYGSGGAFREANEQILALIAERRSTRLLGDVENLGPIDEGDQVWLARDWLPRAAAAGLRFVALITPAFDMDHAPMMLVGERLPADLTLRYFEDRDAGAAWLASF